MFREKGYRGASLAAVADSLGTDRATLYYYIGSKEELFHEIVYGAAEANAADAEEIRDSDGPATDKIGRLITALDALIRQALSISLRLHPAGRQPRNRRKVGLVTEDERHLQALRRSCARTVRQQGIRRGSIRTIGSARTIANGIIGMVNGRSPCWYRTTLPSCHRQQKSARPFADATLMAFAQRHRT